MGHDIETAHQTTRPCVTFNRVKYNCESEVRVEYAQWLQCQLPSFLSSAQPFLSRFFNLHSALKSTYSEPRLLVHEWALRATKLCLSTECGRVSKPGPVHNSSLRYGTGIYTMDVPRQHSVQFSPRYRRLASVVTTTLGLPMIPVQGDIRRY